MFFQESCNTRSKQVRRYKRWIIRNLISDDIHYVVSSCFQITWDFQNCHWQTRYARLSTTFDLASHFFAFWFNCTFFRQSGWRIGLQEWSHFKSGRVERSGSPWCTRRGSSILSLAYKKLSVRSSSSSLVSIFSSYVRHVSFTNFHELIAFMIWMSNVSKLIVRLKW